jgi:capsular exopolysaccharide family
MRSKKELIAQKDPKSPVSEVFRTLRTNIQFMSTNKKLRTLLVTSTFPSEGKSWVASNLAVTFAQAGNKVILIDADMRKGRQYTIFGASPRPGLSNYLSGIDEKNGKEPEIVEYLQKTDVDNLLLMAAGNIPPNPSELLVSPQMNKLLEDLKEACDIIVIDGTPCELVTDSIILSRIVDSTVVVTAHKETKKDNLSKIIRNIQNVGGHLAGVVINKMPISIKKYNENYYYASTSGDTMKSSRNEIKEKAYNVLKQNDTENYNRQKKDRASSVEERNKANIEDVMEKPKFVKNGPTDSIDRSIDILQQINSYLDNEKKNLN